MKTKAARSTSMLFAAFLFDKYRFIEYTYKKYSCFEGAFRGSIKEYAAYLHMAEV